VNVLLPHKKAEAWTLAEGPGSALFNWGSRGPDVASGHRQHSRPGVKLRSNVATPLRGGVAVWVVVDL
jgi:hypothetical protein